MILYSDDEVRHQIDAIEDDLEILRMQHDLAMDEVRAIQAKIQHQLDRRSAINMRAIADGRARKVEAPGDGL